MFLILDKQSPVNHRFAQFHDVQKGHFMTIKMSEFYTLLRVFKNAVAAMTTGKSITKNFEHGEHVYKVTISKKDGGMLDILIWQRPSKETCAEFEISEINLYKLREHCRDKKVEGFIFENGKDMYINRRIA